jgi:hypothetical protein
MRPRAIGFAPLRSTRIHRSQCADRPPISRCVSRRRGRLFMTLLLVMLMRLRLNIHLVCRLRDKPITIPVPRAVRPPCRELCEPRLGWPRISDGTYICAIARVAKWSCVASDLFDSFLKFRFVIQFSLLSASTSAGVCVSTTATRLWPCCARRCFIYHCKDVRRLRPLFRVAAPMRLAAIIRARTRKCNSSL